MNERPFGNIAEWYFRNDTEENRFYELFFRFCHKYNVNWSSANAREKAFIEEITRVTYEREYAIRNGLPLDSVKPAFAS